MPRVALVLPALNEEATIAEVVSAARRPPVDIVIVVDNGSVDRTGDIARTAGATVVLEPRRGYGSACLAGLNAARATGVEVIAMMDADGSDAPDHLGALITPVVRGEADLVLGVRDPARTERGALTLQQRFGNRLAVTLMKLLVGADYSDLPPAKAFRSSLLDRLDLRDTGFGFTIELLLRAFDEGLSVLEVPVPCRRRRGGKSKVSGTLRGTFGAGYAILGAVLTHGRRNRSRTRT